MAPVDEPKQTCSSLLHIAASTYVIPSTEIGKCLPYDPTLINSSPGTGLVEDILLERLMGFQKMRSFFGQSVEADGFEMSSLQHHGLCRWRSIDPCHRPETWPLLQLMARAD